VLGDKFVCIGGRYLRPPVRGFCSRTRRALRKRWRAFRWRRLTDDTLRLVREHADGRESPLPLPTERGWYCPVRREAVVPTAELGAPENGRLKRFAARRMVAATIVTSC